MIFQLLIKDDTRLVSSDIFRTDHVLHDLSQQETLSLLQQEEIARRGLHFGDVAFINFNRMLLYLTLKHGPGPKIIVGALPRGSAYSQQRAQAMVPLMRVPASAIG
jgi:hypothetical protein